MKATLAILSVFALVLCSCTTMQPSTYELPYQSQAPEERGERAIASSLELISEVELNYAVLGVFFSKEIYEGGEVENILFTVRNAQGYGTSSVKGTISNYLLSETSSLSVYQAKKLLTAIDSYLAMDSKTLTPAQMYNFELYSGTLNMMLGTEKYRPFKKITFIVICTVTNSGKFFRTIFPIAQTFGTATTTTYKTYQMNETQVSKLRGAISAALDKSKPIPAPTSEKPSGS
jgi:hypothetical protein